MNSVKIAYLICAMITQFGIVAGMLFIPIYVTPDNYFWSGAFAGLFFMHARGFNERLNSWKEFGKT